jgi:23S rRNA pseudouridine2605 synthase
MGVQVGPGDDVSLDGAPLAIGRQTYILLNKPGDTITTKSDERDRSTVMDLIDLPPDQKDALFPVGRLDRHTIGVLLLTSDGELGHRLMHPSRGVEKVYKITTEAPLTDAQLQQLVDGVELDDGPAHADQVAFLGNRTTVGLAIHEGRNRQVRRMIEALGTRVARLERVRYAGLSADGVRQGKWRHLTPREVDALRKLVR